MEKDILREKLSKYYDSETLIEYKCQEINEFDEQIKNEFFKYLETGIMPDIEANGWTFKQVYEKMKYSESIIEVFIHYNKIKTEPVYARGFRYLSFGRK